MKPADYKLEARSLLRATLIGRPVVKSEDRVVEIGSGDGAMTAELIELAGVVYGFEPTDLVDAARRAAPSAVIRRAAVIDGDAQTVTLNVALDEPWNSTLYQCPYPIDVEPTVVGAVDVARLDGEVAVVDVEGAEIDLLPALPSCFKTLVAEMHASVVGVQQIDALRRRLTESGWQRLCAVPSWGHSAVPLDARGWHRHNTWEVWRVHDQ